MIIHNAQDYLKIISGQRTVWTRVSRNGDMGKISITGRFVCSFVRKKYNIWLNKRLLSMPHPLIVHDPDSCGDVPRRQMQMF